MDLGFNSLIEQEGKAIAAQWVNIIQHPNGEPKQLSLRENQVVDASLLFRDEPLATYFRDIFEHDWSNLAVQNIGDEARNFELATSDDPTPQGFVRLTWKDYMEML